MKICRLSLKPCEHVPTLCEQCQWFNKTRADAAKMAEINKELHIALDLANQRAELTDGIKQGAVANLNRVRELEAENARLKDDFKDEIERLKEQLRLTHIDWCNELNENARLREENGRASNEVSDWVRRFNAVCVDRDTFITKNESLRNVVAAAKSVRYWCRDSCGGETISARQWRKEANEKFDAALEKAGGGE